MHDKIDRRTSDGVSIGVIQDYTRGLETHTRAVDEYLRPVFEGCVTSFTCLLNGKLKQFTTSYQTHYITKVNHNEYTSQSQSVTLSPTHRTAQNDT